MRSHYCGQVNEKLVGQEVTVAGWVHRRRDHGGVIFVDLRDREGLLQIVFDPDNQAQFSEAEKLRNEFVVKVRGLVREQRGEVVLESRGQALRVLEVGDRAVHGEDHELARLRHRRDRFRCLRACREEHGQEERCAAPPDHAHKYNAATSTP